MTTSEHPWTDGDNLIAYHLYRFGANSLPMGKPELAKTMGMSVASLNFKIGNFKAIDGRGGFDGYSQQAVRIFKRYSSVSDAAVTDAALQAVVQALETQMNTLKDELAKRRQ